MAKGKRSGVFGEQPAKPDRTQEAPVSNPQVVRDHKTCPPKMVQNHKEDFEAIEKVLSKAYEGPPIAFVRFADGELSLMEGTHHKAKSDGWQSEFVHQKWRDGLLSAITNGADDPGWYVGISSTSHHGAKAHAKLRSLAQVPEDRLTLAELFIFNNYAAVKDWDLGRFLVCAQRSADTAPHPLHIPKDAILRAWDHKPLVNYLIDQVDDRPILVSGGAAAKLIITDYWRRCTGIGRTPRTIIDIGSAIDPKVRGRRTRMYHNPDHEVSSIVPSFK